MTPDEIQACDHWVGVNGSGHYRYASDTPESLWDFTFCPKCGKKLMTESVSIVEKTADDRICEHIEKTKRLFFNGRKDTPWVCLKCGEKL